MTVHFSALRSRRRRTIPPEKDGESSGGSGSCPGAEILDFEPLEGSSPSFPVSTSPSTLTALQSSYYSAGIMFATGLLIVSFLAWVDRSSGSISLFPPPLGGAWKVAPLVPPVKNTEAPLDPRPASSTSEQSPSSSSSSSSTLPGGGAVHQRQRHRLKRDKIVQWLSTVQHWVVTGHRNHHRRRGGRASTSTEGDSENGRGGVATAEPAIATALVSSTDALKFATAFTGPPDVSDAQLRVLRDFSTQVYRDVAAVPSGSSKATTLSHRLSQVPWGGTEPWWDPPSRSSSGSGSTPANVLDQLDGGRLLHSYYRIMQVAHDKHNSKRHPHQSLTDLSEVYFPFGPCSPRRDASHSSSSSGGGCPASRAIEHTLTWRETYRPWMVDPAALAENSKGWIYARGFSPPSASGTGSGSSSSQPAYGQHAILWARPGVHRSVDGASYVRCLLHSADRAVALSLQKSHGRVGKFNAVVDATGYEFGKSLPALSHLKEAVHLLQDHFPDRLGVVVLVNLSRTAELVVNLVKPWLTKEVRDKIHAVRADQLSLLVEPHDIPDWLGGPDNYRFDPESYYPREHRCTAAEVRL